MTRVTPRICPGCHLPVTSSIGRTTILSDPLRDVHTSERSWHGICHQAAVHVSTLRANADAYHYGRIDLLALARGNRDVYDAITDRPPLRCIVDRMLREGFDPRALHA